MRYRFALAILTIHTSLAAGAQDSVTLPLQGYYHAGRYMPVRVMATPPAKNADLVLKSPGAVWTFMSLQGARVNTVVPFMPVDARAQQLVWAYTGGRGTVVDPPLRPLDDRQRLVGYAGVDSTLAMAAAGQLYPGDPLIPVPLNDPVQPLPGNAASWETLDAVILDANSARRIDEQQFSALVACGVAFAVRADAPPWPHWPWKSGAGGWQLIHHTPAGPRGATYSPAAYLPVESLQAGWPDASRRLMFEFAAIFSIVLLLLALWRPRFVAVLALIVGAACLVGLHFWWRNQKPVLFVAGKIRIITPGITQDDDWAYQTSHQPFWSNVHWADVTKLVFAGPEQLDVSGARVVCFSNGDPDFIFFKQPAKAKVALLSRRAGPQPPLASPAPVNGSSPLISMVKELYLQPGDQIAGETASSPIVSEAYFTLLQWPGVVVRRK